jgi:hypothetical protein
MPNTAGIIDYEKMVPELQVATAIRLEEKRELVKRGKYEPLTRGEVKESLKRLGLELPEKHLDYFLKNELLIQPTTKNNKSTYETSHRSRDTLDSILQLLGWLKVNDELTV